MHLIVQFMLKIKKMTPGGIEKNFFFLKLRMSVTGILVNRAMGFPTEFFPVLFAIPRMAGYLAHWRESLDDPDTKIMRPQQVTS